MNLTHFRTFVWLRWRLRVNQMRRGGAAGVVILGLLLALVIVVALSLFGVFLVAGIFGLRDVEPAVLMYVWDGLVAAFLFSWMTGLLADLQRAEPLALGKFLHLPVSVTGAFLINYLSSLFSVTLVLFGSAMLGLTVGLVISRGPALLMQVPLLLAFVFAVTALTYQFQGWLASLMTNPRRRRTVILVATALFILVAQLPNIVNFMRPWDGKGRQPEHLTRYNEEVAELRRAVEAGKIPPAEYRQRLAELEQRRDERAKEADRQLEGQVQATVRMANLVLPPGWLPLGVAAAAEGNFLPGLIGSLGLGLVGAASLWRAYRTTLLIYTGQFTAGKDVPLPAPAAPARPAPAEAPAGKPARLLLDRDLPGISEQAAAIALGSFTSFLRAPESKMMLLTPLLFALIFGSMLFSGRSDPAPLTRPMMVLGGMAMVLFSTLQLAGNLFGFDRAGFRVYVLSPVPRREVLLGKNLAFAPLPLALGLLVLAVVGLVYPMRIDHLLATVPTMLSMYLLFILTANWLSILAPIPIAAGSFKPSNPKMIPLLMHLLFLFVFPAALAPALIPLAVEFAAGRMGWGAGVPLFLILAVLECAALVLFYRVAVGWQGRVLHAREQHILNVVTATKD